MLLRDWVAREGRGSISRVQFAAGLAYSTVYKAFKGTANLRSDTAQKISDATDGEVSVEELCGRHSRVPVRASASKRARSGRAA